MADPNAKAISSMPFEANANGDSSSEARGLGAYTRYVIALLTVVSTFSYMDRMALAALAPAIKEDLDLSDAQLGLLTGFAFSLFYAVCGIPIARWADRGVRRNIITLALAGWSVMTALSGAAQNFMHLFLARVGIGAGEAGCLPPGQSILCDYVPVQRRAGAFAVHNAGNYAGMMLGLMLAGWLGEIIGWRWTFLALGLPGIGLAVVVRLTLREPVRGSFDDRNRGELLQPSLRDTLAQLWRCKTYRLLLSFYVLNGFTLYGLIQWWPSFYSRVFELSMASIGLYLGLAIGIGAGAGSLLGGWLAHKTGQRDLGLPLRISAAITLLAVPAALASLFVSSIPGSIVLVFLSALFWSACNGPVIATAVSVVAPTMRATSSSLIIFATAILGFGLGPFCVGLLSDLLTPFLAEQALRYALLLPISLLPMVALMVYAAARACAGDLRSVPGTNITSRYA
jgi:predicted MFS family arabinose efflux permease